MNIEYFYPHVLLEHVYHWILLKDLMWSSSASSHKLHPTKSNELNYVTCNNLILTISSMQDLLLLRLKSPVSSLRISPRVGSPDIPV